MDFVPLFTEDYYLLAKRETTEREDVESLIAVLRGDAFRRVVHAFPGYDASLAGTITTLGDAIFP